MSKLQDKIETSQQNWIKWFKVNCKKLKDIPKVEEYEKKLIKDYERFAKNQHVSEVVKLAKEGFMDKLNKEE